MFDHQIIRNNIELEDNHKKQQFSNNSSDNFIPAIIYNCLLLKFYIRYSKYTL